jgi:hypothetical protein
MTDNYTPNETRIERIERFAIYTSMATTPDEVQDMLMTMTNTIAAQLAQAVLISKASPQKVLGSHPTAHDAIVTAFKEVCELAKISWRNVGSIYAVLSFVAYVRTTGEDIGQRSGMKLETMQVERPRNEELSIEETGELVKHAMKKARTDIDHPRQGKN